MLIKRNKSVTSNLFFISSLPGLEKDLVFPKVPVDFLTKNKFEDYKTPRVCLYPSIDEGLMSLSGFSKDLSNKEFYIYTPVGIFKDSLIRPDITMVPDSMITNEYWYLRNLRLKYLTKIKVLDKDTNSETIYHYGPRSSEDRLYKWKWEEILKPWEKSKL